MRFSLGARGYLQRLASDSTAVTLILTNLFTIVVALLFNWSYKEVYVIACIQAIIIGCFAFIGILINKNFLLQKSDLIFFSVEWAQKLLGSDVDFYKIIKHLQFEGEHGPLMSALSFVILYSIVFVIVVFYGLIILLSPFAHLDLFAMSLVATAYFFQHLFSFILHLPERNIPLKGQAAKEYFEEPFQRVFLIYIVGCLAGIVLYLPQVIVPQAMLLLLLGAKMIVDVRAHIRKHYVEKEIAESYKIMRNRKWMYEHTLENTTWKKK